MRRLAAVGPAVVFLCATASVPASAQSGAARVPSQAGTRIASAVTQGELRGTVLDERGRALAGAVVSAVGATSAFAVSEADGRFVLRNLPPGAYLVRAHLQGYTPARGQMVQVAADSRSVPAIRLTRTAADGSTRPEVLTAGFAAAEPTDAAADVPSPEPAAEKEGTEPGEFAWRLRHLRRSVLKDDTLTALPPVDLPSFSDDPLQAVARAVEASARGASAWLADLPLSGQVNLLTRTSFDRAMDLLTLGVPAPRSVTYVALSTKNALGDWSARGAITQGDLSSWIVSGGFVRRTPGSHQYEAGMSYGTQRYRGNNVATLATLPDGSRTVGAVYASDQWTLSPRLDVGYGARYARYDYLLHRDLISPSASLAISPFERSSLRLTTSVAHNEVAPGADEFLPPSSGLWLPPDRTFSALTPGAPLMRERVDHVEVAAEHGLVRDVTIGVRAFRERVSDQNVTVFGVSLPDAGDAQIGHYYVASAGDVDASGWGIGLSRNVEGLRASVQFSQTDARWTRGPRDLARLALYAPSAIRPANERFYGITGSLETELPATATRLIVLYKVNSGFAGTDEAVPGAATRFAVQVNQALPFMNFSAAQWEMLVAVRNVFSQDFRDGSVYDELLIVRPPKRIVGGVTVRF